MPTFQFLFTKSFRFLLVCSVHLQQIVNAFSVDLVQACATDAARSLDKCARKLNEWEEVCSCQEDFCNTFSYMRDRLKRYDNDPEAKKDVEGFDTSNIIDVSKSNKRPPKNQHLILLLVVIPLGVGALAVCLIFVNYHCKMC